MIDKPILYSTDMVRAILAGRKTKTRRVVTQGLKFDIPPTSNALPKMWEYGDIKCPYAADRLWVRETWSASRDGRYIYDVEPAEPGDTIWYKADANRPAWAAGSWKPSIFMPRWANRIMLDVVDVSMEPLHQIADQRGDCLAEGVQPTRRDGGLTDFIELWDSINASRGYTWRSNPWVWVVTFKLIETENEV